MKRKQPAAPSSELVFTKSLHVPRSTFRGRRVLRGGGGGGSGTGGTGKIRAAGWLTSFKLSRKLLSLESKICNPTEVEQVRT